MQILRNTALIFLFGFLTNGFAQAQTDVQQRVERYLFSNYNTNKAAIRENERIIRILEERFDGYMDSLDKETKAKVAGQDKEVKQYLSTLEKVRDVEVLAKMVEEAQTRNAVALDKFVNKGLNTAADALECRKIIVIRLAEHELISSKQEKLVALLKDDNTRQKFIQSLIRKGKVEENADLKAFAKLIDLEVLEYEI